MLAPLGDSADSAPSTPPRPRLKDLGKHGLWIYGAVVALAIREAILSAANHPRDGGLYVELIEAIRFLAFLFVITRFYLGAAHFFESVHGDSADTSKYPPERTWFGIDFTLGLAHFLLFFGWALSLNHHNPGWLGASHTLWWIWGILAYDFIWFLISLNHSTRDDIAGWTAINLLTVVASAVLFALVCFGYNLVRPAAGATAIRSAELLAMVPVFYFGRYDFKMLLWGTKVLPERLKRWINIFAT